MARSIISTPNSGLVLKRHLVGDVGLGPPRWILGPALGQVQREVHRHVLRAFATNGQAGRHLAIGDLPIVPELLSLHAHGVRALLREARIVDDQSVTGSRAVIAASA